MDGVLILAGPTASGKTALAIRLAQRFGAEIVGADSRQVYAGMPIGTAAPTAEQQAQVTHHLVGFLDPFERYSAGRFVTDALAAIDEIAARGKRVLVVGGTGFYVRALAGDVDLARAYDDELRRRLAREARVHPPEVLHAWLAVRCPQRAQMLQPGDTYRVLRALEVALADASGDAPKLPSLKSRGIAFAKVFLDVPLAVLEERIAARTDAMVGCGLVDEAQRIGESAVAANAVGYPQALAYLRGESTSEEFRSLLVRATRRYAKRQISWFRAEPQTLHLTAERVEHAARELLGWV